MIGNSGGSTTAIGSTQQSTAGGMYTGSKLINGSGQSPFPKSSASQSNGRISTVASREAYQANGMANQQFGH